MPTRAYRPPRRSSRADATRGKIVQAVRELLAEGTFHEATVEEVADRAGVARATLYLHFRSRLDLVDAMCETFAENPALRHVKQVIDDGAVETVLTETIDDCVEFWSSEDEVLRELYGVVSLDPAAEALVDRQRSDRHRAMRRLAKRLHAAGILRRGLGERRALAHLMVLTSYETYRELRLAGLADRDLAAALQDAARSVLL